MIHHACHSDKIEKMNRRLKKASSLQEALRQAREGGAFQLPGVVFYHHRLWRLGDIKKELENAHVPLPE